MGSVNSCLESGNFSLGPASATTDDTRSQRRFRDRQSIRAPALPAFTRRTRAEPVLSRKPVHDVHHMLLVGQVDRLAAPADPLHKPTRRPRALIVEGREHVVSKER